MRTTTRSTRSRQTGSERLLQLELFPLEMLTSVPLKTSAPPTSPATPSSTSSPASASGPTPSVRPDGPMTVPSGQQVARASLSPRQARAADLMTSGTSGQHSTGSQASVDLTSSLASRYRARTALLGSTLYRLTWKPRATPLGRSIPAQRGSVRPRSASAFTGWPTPRVGNNGGHGNAKRSKQGRLEDVVQTSALGPTSSGSSAATDDADLLNPAFARWLQGVPDTWNDFAVTATGYARQSPWNSSEHISIVRRLPDTAAARMKRRSRSFM